MSTVDATGASDNELSAGPVVLITGASSGIGRAAAIELARDDERVLVLVARRGEQLEHTARLARAHNVACIPCDLTDAEAIAELAQQVGATYGRLDALINNAGSGTSVEFEAPESPAELERLLALNVRAPMLLTHHLGPLLEQSGGVVVNVSSVAGLVGTPASPVYSASKWALTGFSESMRARWAERGVRVVCVQPGPVPTPGWPHEWVTHRRFVGRVLACDDVTIARAIVRAVEGRGGVSPIRPRTYAVVPVLRAFVPWLVRRALVSTARSGSSGRRSGMTRT